MTEFEQVLEECLRDLEQGASTLDECLARHPGHAAQLGPILLAAARLEQGREVRPSAAFKARTRLRLTQHMQAHPRKRARFNSTSMRFAASLAAILLALLVTGTAYAQDALPGDVFYSWKLASESTWRAFSTDHVRTDLAIANRRINEMNAVSDDPLLSAEALKGYHEVVARLESELGPETLKSILPAIEPGEQLEESTSTPIPLFTPTPSPSPSDEVDDIVTPQPGSTNVPPPALPKILPTRVRKLIPTIQIPPPIR
jgi:hypothetical protein